MTITIDAELVKMLARIFWVLVGSMLGWAVGRLIVFFGGRK